MSHWIDAVLAAPLDLEPCPTVADWWPRHLALAGADLAPIELAIIGGVRADRVGWAFASAYQAALRALVPALPHGVLAALCVTERDGNTPRAIATELRRDGGGYRLSGAKRWTTLGPGGQLFLVAARDVAASGERPALKLVRVPADAPGVQVEPMPPTPFVPEVPHAQLRFDAVAVPEEAVLPGDGYLRYVKPFRTVEDTHVNAAVLAYLAREARRLAWPRAWLEQATAALLSLAAIAALDAAAAATHVALAGALAEVARLAGEADGRWQATPQDAALARWQRDRALFGIAAAARGQRTQRAWEGLA